MSHFTVILAAAQSLMLTAVAFLFVLSLIVVVHELGHFLVARWCGVKVDAFAVGFGREVAGFNDRYGTRWRLNWIPLGGYVKFMDDANAASVADEDILAKLTPEQRKTSFHAKKLWQRAAVIAAGPAANFLLAIAIFAGMHMVIGVRSAPAQVEAVIADSPAAKAGIRGGDVVKSVDGAPIDTYNDLERMIGTSYGQTLALDIARGGQVFRVDVTPTVTDVSDDMGGHFQRSDIGLAFPARVEAVMEGKPAAAAGLRKGDMITAVDGTPIATFNQLRDIVSASAGKALKLTFVRDGITREAEATPAATEEPDGKGGMRQVGRLGFVGSNTPSATTWRRYGPVEAIGLGAKETYFFVTQQIIGLQRIATAKEDPRQLRGTLGIAASAGKVASYGFDALIGFAAILSIAVGFMNLLPIPILDGGHLMFYAVEAVQGRPLSARVKETSLRVGFAILAALFLFTFGNDLVAIRNMIRG